MVFSLLDLNLPFAKKETTEIGSYAPAQNIHQPYETFAPVTSTQTSYQISPQYSYGVQIASPNAVMTTKKEDTLSGTQKTSQEPYFNVPQTTSTKADQSTGISNTTIAVVAAIAIIGVLVIK